jgi:hypothetical protein
VRSKYRAAEDEAWEDKGRLRDFRLQPPADAFFFLLLSSVNLSTVPTIQARKAHVLLKSSSCILVHVNGVTLRLRTAASNGSIVHPPGDT